jgi:hypothetical protein
MRISKFLPLIVVAPLGHAPYGPVSSKKVFTLSANFSEDRFLWEMAMAPSLQGPDKFNTNSMHPVENLAVNHIQELTRFL